MKAISETSHDRILLAIMAVLMRLRSECVVIQFELIDKP
jgi:hypothetical protein